MSYGNIFPTDNKDLYKALDAKCESCGKSITITPLMVWIHAEECPQKERPVYFCNDDCILAWWSTPEGNPCNPE
jgi:hypothetical protein